MSQLDWNTDRTSFLHMKEPKKGKPIRPNDEVVFFPSAANWNDSKQIWEIKIDGAVFDPQIIKMRKKLMVRLLRSFMKVSAEELDCELFRERIRPFTANALKGRIVRIRVGSREIVLNKRSKRNGHFTASFELSRDEVDHLVEEGAVTNRVLNYELIHGQDEMLPVGGRVHLLLPNGQSVISDVDDTIKHSNVGNRTELLKNTFLRDFEAIDGMAELFRKWSESGIDFHFVSASPWQLINPLRELLELDEFPAGTFSLRTFRWRDQVFKRVVSEKWVGKAKDIRRLIERFPNRSFILIGDSVERDPELYAHLAEKYQEQISAIYIRQVPSFEMSSKRITRVNAQINGTRFETFESSDDLPADLSF